MASIRQQIVDGIVTCMASITTANGYSDTILNVDLWKLRPYEEDQLPAIAIRDTSDDMPEDGVGAGRRDHNLSVFLVVEYSGKASDQQARDTLADMLAAIGASVDTGTPFGVDEVYDCTVDNSDLIPDEANRRVAFGRLVLTVKYRSAEWAM